MTTRRDLDQRQRVLSHTRSGAIEHTAIGAGPVVLIVHGGHSNCREQLGVTPWVEAGFSVWIPSRPGYGQTPLSTGETAEQAADALAELLSLHGHETAVVVGVSAGGPTAIHLAARHPERVDRLVLASAVTRVWHRPGDGLYEMMQRLFGRGQAATWALTRAMFAVAPRLMARTMMKSLTTLDPKQVMAALSADEIAELRHMVSRQRSGRGFLADLEHRVGDEVWASIDTPALIVHSRLDAAVPFAHAEHAAERLVDSRLFEASSPCGHLIWFGPGQAEAMTAMIDFALARPQDGLPRAQFQ